jgi:hypothetical protein
MADWAWVAASAALAASRHVNAIEREAAAAQPPRGSDHAVARLAAGEDRIEVVQRPKPHRAAGLQRRTA